MFFLFIFINYFHYLIFTVWRHVYCSLNRTTFLDKLSIALLSFFFFNYLFSFLYIFNQLIFIYLFLFRLASLIHFLSRRWIKWDTITINFPPFLQRGTTYGTSCLLPWTTKQFQIEICSKRRESAPRGSYCFLSITALWWYIFKSVWRLFIHQYLYFG